MSSWESEILIILTNGINKNENLFGIRKFIV